MTWSIDNLPLRWRLAALVLGTACVMFGQGRWPVPAAAWLAPVLMIAFVRSSRAWVALLGFTLAHTLAWEVAYSGMVKMPTFARLGLFGGLSLVLAVFFVADRWVARRSRAFWTTLVLPTAWVTFEYLLGRFSPNGSWGSLAYTFVGQDELVQVTSLTGWTGLTFLVAWVATTLHWVAREASSGRRVWRQASLTAAVLLGVLVFGAVRLNLHQPSDTVRVASLVGPSSFLADGEFRRDVWAYTRGIAMAPSAVDSARQHILTTMEAHMALARRELEDGARIVSFPEANPSLTSAEEAAWLAAAGALAREHGAYLGLGLYVFRPAEGLRAVNKYVLLGPDGNVAWDYWKSRLVPGSRHVVGDGTLPDLATDFGRLSTAICFDMDFPDLLAQAGRYGTDIVLAPSNDWTEVRALHARMATMRAVEQGFNMVRPTKDGHAIATDALGRVIAFQDTDRPGDHVLIAQVPTEGSPTVYAAIGDVFAWLCMAGFIGMLGRMALRRAG